MGVAGDDADVEGEVGLPLCVVTVRTDVECRHLGVGVMPQSLRIGDGRGQISEDNEQLVVEFVWLKALDHNRAATVRAGEIGSQWPDRNCCATSNKT